MKHECAVTILAQDAKQGTPLSHSKQVACDKEAPRLVSRRPACGSGGRARYRSASPAPHAHRLRSKAALSESRRALGQNSCQPEGLQPESAAHRSVEQGPRLRGCDRGGAHESRGNRCAESRVAGSHPAHNAWNLLRPPRDTALLVLRRFWTFAAPSALPPPILAATHVCFIMLGTLDLARYQS